ncbi:glucan 1,6-alpha-glucosidase [Metamycoplasma buccale]|uniref:alpha-amylase family glycosyl hydrolase n=1 Tax=Metamycoplasma buccale TaxID=55602 RepID=UPI00398EA0C7
MAKKSAKKIILYELKIETFKDSKNNGIGDFNGLWSKNYYFDYLKVNIIAIEDVLKHYENAFTLDEVKNRSGSLNEFVNCVRNYKNKKINIAPIIDFKKLKQTYLNWMNMMNLYSQEVKTKLALTELDTYILNEYLNPKTNIVELANLVLFFDKIINFYLQCGVEVFIFENYDFLLDKEVKINKTSYRFLQDLYKMVKRVNSEAIIILKTSNSCPKLYYKMLKLKEPCCDYIYLNHLSLVGINQKLPFDSNIKLNFKSFKKLLKPYIKDSHFILSFGSNKTGRLNSKWGDELAYVYEAAKAFMLPLFANKNSIAIYYGDELGTLRINIQKSADLNDKDYNEEKRYYESKNINESLYFTRRKYLDKINSQNLMNWVNKKNSGFSDYSIVKPLNSLHYEKINVANQVNDFSSPLNFIVFLTKLILESEYSELLIKSKPKFSCFIRENIIKIIRNYKDKKLIFIVNLSKKPTTVVLNKTYNILASTYVNKFYTKIPTKLDPFEGLIMLKNNNKKTISNVNDEVLQ